MNYKRTRFVWQRSGSARGKHIAWMTCTKLTLILRITELNSSELTNGNVKRSHITSIRRWNLGNGRGSTSWAEMCCNKTYKTFICQQQLSLSFLSLYILFSILSLLFTHSINVCLIIFWIKFIFVMDSELITILFVFSFELK